MLGNKVCVTIKGLDLLSDHKQQFQVAQKPTHTRTGSLPSIKSQELAKRQTISFKQHQNQKLFQLTRRLEQIQKIGIKKLILKKQDKILGQLLKKQMRHQQKYLKSIIPNIIRKTRDPNRTNNLDSRFHRSRAYTERLLQNYQSQKKFGAQNNIRRRKNNEEEEQNNKRFNKI